MPRETQKKGCRVRLRKPTSGKKTMIRDMIRVDERTLILKIIDDASKKLSEHNDKNFLEMAYSLRNNINKVNGQDFSDKEKKEVREFLRKAKITMLLNDKEQEFKALSEIEKDIVKAFRG